MGRGVTELLQLSSWILSSEHVTDHRQQTVDLDAADQASYGKRGLPVVQLGQLVRMHE